MDYGILANQCRRIITMFLSTSIATLPGGDPVPGRAPCAVLGGCSLIVSGVLPRSLIVTSASAFRHGLADDRQRPEDNNAEHHSDDHLDAL